MTHSKRWLATYPLLDSVFTKLPRHQKNLCRIKMQDKCLHGNDETWCFVLINLGVYHVKPALNEWHVGTTRTSTTHTHSPTSLCLHSATTTTCRCSWCWLWLTVVCIEGQSHARLVCSNCMQPSYGQEFLVGSMYAFDLFSAMSCCLKNVTSDRRLECCIHSNESTKSVSSHHPTLCVALYHTMWTWNKISNCSKNPKF